MQRQEISNSKSNMAGSNDEEGRENKLDDHHYHVTERIRNIILKYALKLDMDANKIHLDSEEPIQLVERCLNAISTKYEDQKEQFQEHMIYTHNLEAHNITLQKKVEELTGKAESLRENLYAVVKTKEDTEQAAEAREQILKCKLEEISNELETNIIKFAKQQNEKNYLIKKLHSYIECHEIDNGTDYKEKMADRIKFYETFISRLYQKFMIVVPNPTAKQTLVLTPLDLDGVERCLSKDWDIILIGVQQTKINCDKALVDMRTILLANEQLAESLEQERVKFNDVTQRFDNLNSQLLADHNSVLELIQKLSINEAPVQMLDDATNGNVQSNGMAMALEQLHLKADEFLKNFEGLEKQMALQTTHIFMLEQKVGNRVDSEYIEELQQQNKAKSLLVNELQTIVGDNQFKLEVCEEKLQSQKLLEETLKRRHETLVWEIEELKNKHVLLNDENKKLQNAQELSLKRIANLEKIRSELVLKHQRQDVRCDEQEIVRLTHEIGGLNLEIEQLKKLNREQRSALSVLQAQLQSSNNGAGQAFASQMKFF